MQVRPILQVGISALPGLAGLLPSPETAAVLLNPVDHTYYLDVHKGLTGYSYKTQSTSASPPRPRSFQQLH